MFYLPFIFNIQEIYLRLSYKILDNYYIQSLDLLKYYKIYIIYIHNLYDGNIYKIVFIYEHLILLYYIL